MRTGRGGALFTLMLMAGCGSTHGGLDAATPDAAPGGDAAALPDLAQASDAASADDLAAPSADLSLAPADGGASGADAAVDGGITYGSFTVAEDPPGVDGGLVGGYTVGAAFETLSSDPYSCFGTVVASTCSIATCPAPKVLGGPFKAGTLTLAGGSATVTPTLGANNSYSAKGAGALFVGGETLRFAASGDVAPAFSKTLTAPTPVTVRSPSPTAGALTIDRSQDLAVAWSGGGSGGYVEFVLVSTAGAGTPPLVCLVPTAAGGVTVPKALLGQLQAGGYIYEVVALTLEHGTVGSWQLLLEASVAGKTPGGAEFSGSATLQ